MVFKSKPVATGTYRIKVLNQNMYLEAVPQTETGEPSPWTRLAQEDESDQQKWFLFKVWDTSDEWLIQSEVDQVGLTVSEKTSETYEGHGYPRAGGTSIHWKIVEYNGQYSKISARHNGPDVFDSYLQQDDAVHFWTPSSLSDTMQRYTFEPLSGGEDGEESYTQKLDIMFVQDATGSLQPYINKARDQIAHIVDKLRQEINFANPDDLRFGLIAFRDHDKHDTGVTQSFGFTSDIDTLKTDLAGLRATGGGDGPEAQCHALKAALEASWREDACKVVFLITDSPPHGVEPTHGIPDIWPNGCPKQVDPVQIVELMKDRGIFLNVIACEPTLSNKYKEAHNFYKGLVEKTEGKFVPLGDAEPFQDIITGCALNALDATRLRAVIENWQKFAKERSAKYQDENTLHTLLSQAGVYHYQVSAENIYRDDEQDNKNTKIWAQAKTLQEAKRQIEQFSTQSRIAPQHLRGGRLEPEFTVEKVLITRDNVNLFIAEAHLVGSNGEPFK